MKKSVFERMVEKAFSGLEARYSFKKGETKFENRSVTVRYQNTTTEIILNYEIGTRYLSPTLMACILPFFICL